ncbi:hypothetical protein T03_788, partial [Trichinella britovi]
MQSPRRNPPITRNSLSIKGKLQNVMGYRLVILAKMAKKLFLIFETFVIPIVIVRSRRLGNAWIRFLHSTTCYLENYATGKRVDTFSALRYSTKLHCSEISKKLFPDYCDRRTTERTCSNMYIHSEFSIEIDLVQDWEAVEGKCICGDYCKIVSVNQVDLFVELTREYEAWQKINRRL